jgi:hypothetical protein
LVTGPFIDTGIEIVYSFDFSPQRHKAAEDRKGFLNAFNAERFVHGSLSEGHQIILENAEIRFAH